MNHINDANTEVHKHIRWRITCSNISYGNKVNELSCIMTFKVVWICFLKMASSVLVISLFLPSRRLCDGSLVRSFARLCVSFCLGMKKLAQILFGF